MLIQMHEVWANVQKVLEFEKEHPMVFIPGQPLNARFNAIRHNYKLHQMKVDRGIATWGTGEDPYEIGDWIRLLSPIENAVWRDIRASRLPLWPQFPAGRFFVDFGNPEAKVALECDGKEFHDPQKDAKRDKALLDFGWKVFRVPGWKCLKVIDMPDPSADEEEWEAYYANIKDQTVVGVLQEIGKCFPRS